MIIKKIQILALCSLTGSLFYACSSHSTSSSSISSQTTATVDCTGFTSEMVIPYGLSVGTSAQYANKKFAKLVAIDKGTGEMEISIQAPDGGFPLAFINNFSEYTLRFVACRENITSVTGGIRTQGVCSTLGSVNIVGQEGVTSSDFSSGVYTVNSLVIHATTSPTYDASHSLMKPNFIMLTAGLIDTNPIGEFMIAYGKSPYYNGCY
ncbi:MAG: hypothetical protein WCQ47_07605 [bacterium]